MTRPRYEHVLEVPEGIAWTTTPETANRDVQIAYGDGAELGAPWKRVQNRVTGATTFLRLAAEQEEDGRAGARAFEATKHHDAEQLNAKRRPRCACGKVRRQRATHCQGCLDRIEAERIKMEPPARWSKDWRRDGWLCVFRDGRVYLKGRDGIFIHTAPVGQGEWAYATKLESPPWRQLRGDEDVRVRAFLKLVQRDCYCSSFPDTGCDFCNGTRLPDGAKEI